MNYTTELSTNLLRRLALMQHLGEDFFIIDDIAYEGTEDDAYEQFNADMDSCTDYQDDPIEFKEWAADHLTQIEELEEDDYTIDYMVLTDDEADQKWDESLDSYLEECIYPDLPDSLRFYFDDEKWKNDARMDGRGHSLSSYDGNENEETVNGKTFYIYRTN